MKWYCIAAYKPVTAVATAVSVFARSKLKGDSLAVASTV